MAATLPGGLVGGLVAAAAMSAATTATGDGSPSPTARLWAKYVGGGEPERYAVEGLVLHLAYGVTAGGVFAMAVGALGAGDGPVAGLVVGGVYGLALFAVAAALWLVMVLGISPDRRMALGMVLDHLVYGVVLGAWTGFGVLAGLGIG